MTLKEKVGLILKHNYTPASILGALNEMEQCNIKEIMFRPIEENIHVYLSEAEDIRQILKEVEQT